MDVVRFRDRRVPISALSDCTLPWDYIDLHVLDDVDPGDSTAEQWARTMFEDGRPLRQRRPFGLLSLLQPQPAARPDRVAGWAIAQAEPSRVRLVGRSKQTAEEVVVRVGDRSVSMLTAVRYRSSAGARTWPVLAVLHRRLAPQVLTLAAGELGRPLGDVDGPPSGER